MLLKTKGISKQFNGIYALKDIDFEINAGEVHALVGENGAGKSTFIKILTGVYSLEEGQIFWEGTDVKLLNPIESRRIGINVIHQDHILIPFFNGVENVYLGSDYLVRKGKVDWRAMYEAVDRKAKEIGIEIDLEKTADELTPPQKTCLEIIRAMMHECKLLILDEPTASLTDKEAEILFDIVLKLKQKGTAILYISHRMEEIFRLSDRITIFKNGELSGRITTSEIDQNGLINLMTDEWKSEKVKKSSHIGEVCLEARQIASKDGYVKNGTIVAHSGEILGIYGLGGSGRTELLETIYGYRSIREGSVKIKGKEMKKITPETSIENGMVLISEDRRGNAMIGNLSIKDNILLSCIDNYTSHGVLNEKKEISDVDKKVKELSIKMADIHQRTIELSGGNQQKVVFAKAMMTNPVIYLCDEPTQAVDVKTRAEIHKLLRKKADEGNAVVYVSSDLKEILDVADNILIMSGGCTKELLENSDLKSKDVLAYCYK